MPVGIFMRFEPIHAFGDECRVTRGQAMHLIIESSAFSQEGARHKKTNRAFFALANGSHTPSFP
jgi:hypothetical protein